MANLAQIYEEGFPTRWARRGWFGVSADAAGILADCLGTGKGVDGRTRNDGGGSRYWPRAHWRAYLRAR